MDVVGGVIVAADRATDDERSAGVVGGGLRSRKRGRCGAGADFDDGVVIARGARVRRGDAGARDAGEAAAAGEMVLGVGVGMGIAASAWGDEPWSYRHRNGRTKAGGNDDYALRSMLDNFYRPVSAAAAGGIPATAGFVVAKPVRAWVDPLRFLLKKELTTTDVGDLGRIILPKVKLVRLPNCTISSIRALSYIIVPFCGRFLRLFLPFCEFLFRFVARVLLLCLYPLDFVIPSVNVAGLIL